MNKRILSTLTSLVLHIGLTHAQTPSQMHDFVIHKVKKEEPNNYRAELYKNQRELALEQIAQFESQTPSEQSRFYDVVVFDGKTQRLYHIAKANNSDVLFTDTYTCSSGRYGFSNRANSNKTPTGLMYIQQKNGAGAKLGKVFDYKYAHLPLRTINPGKNTHSRAYMTTRRIDFEKWRGLAIHGTNHEAYLGQPRSHGCIRMSNANVITFFEKVDVATPLHISVDLAKEYADYIQNQNKITQK